MTDTDPPTDPPRWPLPEIPEKKLAAAKQWRNRLNNGFHLEAFEVMRRSAFDENEHPAYRIQLLKSLVKWQERQRLRPEPRDHDVDVLLISDLSLPGGTTTSNLSDVLALRSAGFAVGLLHHPNYGFDVARPVNSKIQKAVRRDSGITLVEPADRIHSRLTVIRFPPCMTRLMDTLPQVATEKTVLVVNQSPYYYYGSRGPRRRSWSVPAVRDNIQSWLGDHTWYCAGPSVKQALRDYHGEDLTGVDLADSYWYDIIADAGLAHGARSPRRRGRINIGRHSRDSKLKWPEDPAVLLAYFPDSPEFTISVLGGAEAPRRILGGIPANWTVHDFDAIDVDTFLDDLDFMVYVIAEDGIEAFGRAPMEAMAAGVPCVLDPRFAPVFGDGAVYATPENVEKTLRNLHSDQERYERQSQAGIDYVREHFSETAFVRRIRTILPPNEPAHSGPIDRLASRFRLLGGRRPA